MLMPLPISALFLSLSDGGVGTEGCDEVVDDDRPTVGAKKKRQHRQNNNNKKQEEERRGRNKGTPTGPQG